MNIVKNVKVRQNNYSDSLIKMTITNEAIVFIFSKKSQKKPKNISFSKIKSLDVTADISNYRDVYDQLPTTHCVTNIKIETKSSKSIKLKIYSSDNFSFGCSYQLIVDLIDNSLILPNFKYKIIGNAYSAINDINYYEQHKKHLPMIKRIFLFFNEISIIDKFGYLILIACIIFVICLIIYTEYNKILLFG